MRPSKTSLSLWTRTGEDLLWTGGCYRDAVSNEPYVWDSSVRGDRPHYVLQLTLSGEGFYERGGVTRVLGPGAALLDRIPGDFRYGFLPRAAAPYEFVFVTFSGPTAERICAGITEELGHVLELGRGSAAESMMLTLAHQFKEGHLHDRYLVSGGLYQLLMTVVSTVKMRGLATSPLLSRAIAAVDEGSCDSRFDVQSLARALACSREHLTRQFRGATGVSAAEYIAQHRLRRSAALLRRSDDKLDSIARASGFGSASHFCRAFRKRYGVTPGTFRRTPWLALE
jgi:AraC family transcriptional regulator, arabinose operon regulatory protein